MGCANGKLQNAMGAYVLQFQLYQREALPYWLASIIMLGNALAVGHYTPDLRLWLWFTVCIAMLPGHYPTHRRDL
jgi:hypothetical protein